MKKIRTLTVVFENEINPNLIPAFRGAIIEKVGRENILFNHHLDDDKYLFRYPLIQYKSIRKKPAVLCLGDGVDEIHKLFNQPTWEIRLKEEKIDLKIDRLDLNNTTLNVWDTFFSYRLSRWLALSEKNYQQYKDLSDESSRIKMLEKILVGNILSFSKGLNWKVEKQIKLNIREIKKSRKLEYKGVHLLAFDVNFSANVFLPNYIGLGKGASHGFGVVLNKKEEKN